MHATASTAIELPATRRRRINRLERAATSVSVPAIELLHDAGPVSFIDLDSPSDAVDSIVPRERSEALSRAVNLTLGLLAVVCLAPLFVLIALAVRLTSNGPIFYSQVRVGVDRRYKQKSTYDRRGYDHGGKPFMMFKFRTMQVDAEADGQAVWAARADPRVTFVGNILRRTRLDELPQLLNVIMGDMNIVGPRPERPTIFADMRQTIPQYPMRQRVKPGITGWAQINHAYDTCIDDVRKKVEFDLEYMRNQSLAHDLRIMTMTLPVMIFRKGSR